VHCGARVHAPIADVLVTGFALSYVPTVLLRHCCFPLVIYDAGLFYLFRTEFTVLESRSSSYTLVTTQHESGKSCAKQ